MKFEFTLQKEIFSMQLIRVISAKQIACANVIEYRSIPFLLELFVGILKRIFCFTHFNLTLVLPCLWCQDSFEPVLFQPINWAIHKLLWLQRVYNTIEVNHQVFDANSTYQIIKDIAFHKMYFSSIVLCTCIFYIAESSHFRGGIITWKPAENNQVRVNILFI